jgi:Ca2+-binding EF-hand superfamily protein
LLCDHDYKDMEEALNLAVKEDLNWNSTNSRGSSWILNSGALDLKHKTNCSYEAYLDMKLDEGDSEQIDKDIGAGRTDAYTFNCDLSAVLSKVKTSELRYRISRVLTAFCARNPHIGYCQGMNSIVAWLLLFLDEESAFWMLCQVVETTLLPDFYGTGKRGNSLNGFYIEATVIAALLTHCIPELSAMSMSVSNFSDMFSIQLLIQLFVNVLQVSCTIFLWDQLTSEGVRPTQSIAIIRGVVAIVAANLSVIVNDEHPVSLVKRLNQLEFYAQLTEKYREVSTYVTDRRVTRLRKQARDYRAKQWTSCEKVQMKRLQNVSGFSESELKACSNEFKRLVEASKQDHESSRSMSISAVRSKTVVLPEHMQRELMEQSTVGISKKDFIGLMSRFNSQLVTQAELIFDRFDEDRSGYLDFRELMICLSVLSKGSFEDKLHLCFDLYDLEKSGYLHSFELNLLLEAVLRPYTDDRDGGVLMNELRASQRKIMNLAGGQTGIVSFSEFCASIMSDPLLYNSFSLHMNSASPSHIVTVMTGQSPSRQPTVPIDEFNESRCLRCLVQ